VLSAGILMYRRIGSKLEVLLVHPGRPYWRRKDNGTWSIPKGEMDAGEDVIFPRKMDRVKLLLAPSRSG
jgi:predicted NUDIX family NTP pyrophosphohydrolase